MAEQIIDGVVQAAGGVTWRASPGVAGGSDAVEVLLVHRPRYDDWTFPKGKLEPGETLAEGAVRELLEETGHHVELGPEIAVATYTDHLGRDKVVHYFAAQVVGGVFGANEEVDLHDWVVVGSAHLRLSYVRDVAVRDAFVTWFGSGGNVA